MKKNFKVLLLAVFVSAASCSFTTKKFEDPDKDKLLVDLVTYVIKRFHFDMEDLNDRFSEDLYNGFIESVDPLKRYFLASDLEEFSKYKLEIDDQIKVKDLTFFNTVHDRLLERMEESQGYYSAVLEKPFDFNKSESIYVDYDKTDFAKGKKDLKERWRKQMKFSTISNFYDLIEEKSKSETAKKEAESKGETYEPTENALLSKEEAEAKAREQVMTSLDEYFDFMSDQTKDDYFAIFLNKFVEGFDPHTNYFAPTARDRFDLQMSGKLEGIGARLQKKNDYITIVEVISGGPTWRGEHLEVGDVILKVKQEDEKDPTSIVGMRVDDAVKLIKGPKGSKVYLTIKRVDGTVNEEVITRDVVELEETYAKSVLVDKENIQYGLINLPGFYFDMTNGNGKNAASDVRSEILRLKEEGMEGLILDLRDNGGGSLKAAVDIGGLFIEDGPMVQVASGDKQIDVLKDVNPEQIWDGPLVILVNELSASSSEILAAAMQDYKRAVVIGSTQTYGKGTVQNLLDLNQWLRNSDMGDMGSLKLTTQKFYRVNGGSTQLEGVKSDVVMADRYSYIDIGERDYKNPLPYDKIAPATYKVWDGYADYDEAIAKSKARLAQSKELRLIDENAKWIKNRRDEMEVTLNLAQYQADIEARKEETKKFDAIDTYDNKLNYRSLSTEMEQMKQDTVLREKRKRWHKSLAKDIYVNEAVNVLEDLKLNTIKTGKLANIKD